MLQFDHVVIAVQDLDAATARFQNDHSIAMAPGGVHPIGTKNSANRFWDWSYIELLAVHDSSKPYGAVIERFLSRRGEGLFSWAVRTDDIDAVAARVGIEPIPGEIRSHQGQLMGSWRIVSHPEPGRSGAGLPFFIEYDIPAHMLARHPHLATSSSDDVLEIQRQDALALGVGLTQGGIAWVAVGTDPDILQEWLGPHGLDVRFTADAKGLHSVGVAVDGRDVTLR